MDSTEARKSCAIFESLGTPEFAIEFEQRPSKLLSRSRLKTCIHQGDIQQTVVFPQPFRSFFNNQKTRPGSGFVAKITSSGAVAWARNVGGNGYTEGYGAAVDHDGNVFVVGDYAYADLVSGTTTLTNPSPLNTDIFLVKYSLDGQILWAKRAGGTDSDYPQGITVDPSGNCLITGHFYSSTIQFGQTNLAITPSGNNGSDLFVVKYSPAGDVI